MSGLFSSPDPPAVQEPPPAPEESAADIEKREASESEERQRYKRGRSSTILMGEAVERSPTASKTLLGS